MATVKKSITVTDQQEAWIQAQLAEGHYATDSELIREAIREKQLRSAEIDRIRAALIQADASGFSEQDKDTIQAAVKDELRRDGAL